MCVCHEFSNLNLEDFEAFHWSAAGAFLLVERPAAPAGRDLKCYKIVVNMSHGNGSSTFIFQVTVFLKTSYRFYRQGAMTFPLADGRVPFTMCQILISV